MELKQLLRELCEANGVSGAENGAAEVAQRWMLPFGDCSLTALGSFVCQIKPVREGAAHILLDAHLDEIGLIVTNVLEDGFLKVAGCGGIDRRLLAATRIVIHGKKQVQAIVCSTPPHLKEPGNKKVGTFDEFTIDTGLSTENMRALIAPGDRATFVAPFTELLGALVSSKALDDRAGCAAVMRAGELLHEDGPDVGISMVLSVMEEVGGQGAATAAYALAPTHAITVDVSFARCEGAPQHVRASIEGGPLIGFAPVLSREMSKELVKTAKKHAIPFDLEAMGGRTGTNADNIATSRAGVKTALISIPQRNMHTPVEIVSLTDVEATAQLIAAYVRENF